MKKLTALFLTLLITLSTFWTTSAWVFDIDLWIKQYIDNYLGLIKKIKDENIILKDRISQLEKINHQKSAYISNEDRIIRTIESVSPSVVSIIASKDLVTIKQNPNRLYDPFVNDPFFNDFFWGHKTKEFYRQNNQWNNSQNNTQTWTEKKTVKVWGWSGFIYWKDWLILTNKHVIFDDNLAYSVILNDWTEYKAKVLAKDPSNDIAVIKIDPNEHKNIEIKPIKLWNSKNIKVWMNVLAIWNALAEFENTVTSWIISAKWRSITASNWTRSEQISNLLQTDTAINPWNSWWPLVNLKWEVIWMNTAIAQSAQWIWFAIPVNDLKFIANNVLAHGKLKIPFIWIRFIPLDNNSSKEFNINATYWALIKWTKDAPWILINSPASKAWIEEMDVILEINWEKIWKNYSEIKEIVLRHKIWDKLELKVLRKWKKIKLEIKLWEFK